MPPEDPGEHEPATDQPHVYPPATPEVLMEVLSTLRAGFLLLDPEGRPQSSVGRVLRDFGIHDLRPGSLETLRAHAVVDDGSPFADDFRPVFDAVFGGIPMIDTVIGFNLEGAAAEAAHRGGQDKFIWVRLDSKSLVVDGEPRILVTAVDVTHVRRAEERLRAMAAELRESERRYRSIVENAAEGVWLLDADDCTVFVNAQMARILRCDPHDVIGRPLDDFLPPGEGPAAAHRLEGRKRGETYHGEASYRAADGHVVETRISAAPVLAEDGSYDGALAMVTDLTEELARRRELEAVVEEQRRRFALVFEHIGDVITVFDPSGEVLFGSPSVHRLLGWPAGHREPDGILGLVHPEDRERAAAALQGVLDGSLGPTDPIVLRVRTAAGDWRYMECVGVDMTREPAIGGIMVTARDMTERHQLTLALEHAATHDNLTGLPNRTLFAEHLAAVLARSERRPVSSAICYLDLDGFKEVNDEHGHGTGDLLLQEISARIRARVRPADIPSRLGGDEFAAVLEDVDKRTAMGVARRLCRDLQEPYVLAEVTVRCGASIGVAFARPGDTPVAWLARADGALYRAKRDGKGVVRSAADSPPAARAPRRPLASPSAGSAGSGPPAGQPVSGRGERPRSPGDRR